MAEIKMGEFLLQYFMQLRFNEMPPEVRAKFDDYAKADDFRGHMKEWKSRLMGNGLPDPNGPDFHLNDEEWENLFREFQSAFRKMDTNRKTFTNDIDFSVNNAKIIDFLNEYFGNGKLFDRAVASPAAEAQIQTLSALLSRHENILKIKLKDWGLTDSGFSYGDLVKAIKDKKYNTDSDIQRKVQEVAQYITAYTATTSYYKDEDLIQAIGSPDFTEIEKGFDDKAVDPAKLTAFKSEYDILLRTLYHNEKIRNAFPSDKIKTAFNTAKENVAYDDQNSKDYIPPKRDDELTPIQQLSKWADDTYADVLEKYLKFKGDRLYFSPNAKQIVGAIHKAKIKPTDGIKAVLDKAGDIKKGLLYKSPKATDHFDWFTKTMSELKDTMPKAFEGALRNGRQMRVIVEEMIMKAVRDGKTDEAKTAMEVLSVIKYGYTTSKIMDTLKKENLSIFSDKGLSWNKNEGVQFVTNALDKSIKAAFMGIGYGITMVGNAINLSGSKFNGKRGRMKQSQQDWEAQNNADLARTRTANTALNNLAQADIADKRQQQQDLNQNLAPGQQSINSRNDYDQQKAALDQARSQETADKAALEQRAQTPAYQASQQRVKDYEELLNTQNSYQQAVPTLQQEISDLDNQIQQIYQNQNMTPAEQQMRSQPLIQAKIQKENDLQQIQQSLPQIAQQINNITSNPNWANDQQVVNQFRQDEQALDARIQQNDAQASRLSQWDSAEKAIDELNKQIDKRNAVVNNWDNDHKDKYMELMAYWDMLETGRDTKMGKMYNWGGRGISAKGAQKKFDSQKQTYINDYLSGYSYAA